MEQNPVILSAIRDSLRTHLREYINNREYIVDREYNYILPSNDDLSSAILLDVITRFGSPGNDNFHKHMKEHRKTQIKNIGKYTKIKDLNSVSDTCAICIESFKLGQFHRKLKCNHCFHKKCIDTWFMKNHSECPMCRAQILD
jgi:hypothetical protein